MPVTIDGTSGVTFNDNSVQAASAFFKRNNILGQVTQSAGVPTGAVIERGSNANGEFVRFADGTQICTVIFPSTAIPANVSVSIGSVNFPAAFVGLAPSLAASGSPTISADFFGVVFFQTPSSLTTMTPIVRNGGTAQNYAEGRGTAIGRWF